MAEGTLPLYTTALSVVEREARRVLLTEILKRKRERPLLVVLCAAREGQGTSGSTTFAHLLQRARPEAVALLGNKSEDDGSAAFFGRLASAVAEEKWIFVWETPKTQAQIEERLNDYSEDDPGFSWWLQPMDVLVGEQIPNVHASVDLEELIAWGNKP